MSARRDVLCGGLAAAAWAMGARDAAAVDDPILLRRLQTRPKTSPWPNDWFQPRGLVRGAARPGPFAPAVDAPLADGAALREAAAFARAHQIEALVVWHDGRFALSDFAPGFDAAAPFNSYHMHWLPLVLAVGAAVDQGRIASLDAPIGTYLDEWSGDDRGRITLRHLLTMSAGLELYRDSVKPEELAAQVFFGGQRTAAILQWPRKTAPGVEFEYNYIVPELIGLILERATGQAYADYLSEKIWRLLGNADAEIWLDRPGGQAYHNAALFASLGDWVNVAILLAGRGRVGDRPVISARWIAEMTTPSAANPNFGFIWLGTPFNPERRFSKDINYVARASVPFTVPDLIVVDGYVHRLFVSPARRLAIVAVGTGGRVDPARRKSWDDAAIPNAVARALRL
jgi:CubicO group peptidase (beta-lactamase class C family)